MPRPHLVIARVGTQSLHPAWLHAAQERSWDLYLCPFEPIAPSAQPGATVGEVVRGPKWTGLRALLESWPGWRDYEYVWLPDDDIFTSQAAIDRMFSLAGALSLQLCAPALHESSYYAHFDTLRNTRCFARRTGFVEIMVPCFRSDVLERLLPTLALSETGWGWGLDSVWPKLLGYQGLGILDAVPVLHTRPVGAFRDAELARRVRAESDRLMAEYDCAQVHTTFEIIESDLSRIELAPDALAARLVEGWSYLWSHDPQVLPWILQAQQPPAGWPAYPIEGCPSCAASPLP